MEDLFEDIGLNIDQEVIYEIDVEQIDNCSVDRSNKLSSALTDHLLASLDDQPHIRAKVDLLKDTLRLYTKMLYSNEQAHDILLKNIAGNPGNASLYQALSRLQSSIMETKNNIDRTIDKIELQLKNIQLEINFDAHKNNTEIEIEMPIGAVRGSRDFVNQMKNEIG